MTSAVDTLSLEPCRGRCKGLGPNNAFKCPDCGGSGALVPGLQERCHCDYEDWDRHECWKCYRIGKHLGEDCERCRGTNKTLIPEAEQMGVLVRYRPEIQIELDRLSSGKWIANGFIDATPEEAWAQALLQALGVE